MARDGAFRLSTAEERPHERGARFHFRVYGTIARHHPRIMLFGQ